MLARAVVVSLLLMNLGVAAWWGLRRPPPEVRPPATDAAIPPLRLLAENEAPDSGLVSAAAEAVGQPPAQGEGVDQQCLQIGPFLTQADLRRALGAFTPMATRIQFRENRVVANRGFWVYLPAQGTREAALAAARELSAQGLRDYYVVTAGDQENTISLGLFRDRSNAEARRREVQGLGFTPELQERTEEIPNYWIEIAAAPGLDWRARLGGYAGVEARPRPCE